MQGLIDLVRGQECVVCGHPNADVDSIISAHLLCDILTYSGCRASVVNFDAHMDTETLSLLTKLSFVFSMAPIHRKNFTDTAVVLVDHHQNTLHLNVVGCIDHHPTNQEVSYPFYVNEKSSATAKLIYDLGRQVQFPFTKDQLRYICFAILVDTVVGKSTKAIPEDISWVKDVCESNHFDYDNLVKVSSSLTDMTTSMQDWVHHGEKTAYYGNKCVKSSYIQVDNCKMQDILDALAYLSELVTSGSADLWVFLVFNLALGETYEFRVADDIHMIRHRGIVSRGTDIMPKIEQLLGKGDHGYGTR